MVGSAMRRGVLSFRYRVLRLRHDWWYRWAHDPLCDRLGGGVLRIGKLRLCRSCLAMYAGLGTGVAVAASAPPLGIAVRFPQVWIGPAGLVSAASLPGPYGRLSRTAKDGLRFSTGLLGGLLSSLALAQRWKPFALLAAAAAGGYRFLTLRRAAAKATACDGCPELTSEGICSGYAQQAVSLRAYERDASELATRERARSMG